MSEISFSANSMFDSFGRVFFCNGKVYRAIEKSAVEDCLILLKRPFFLELMNKGFLPHTLISDFEYPDAGIVLEHEKLMNIQQHEWTFSMLKDAALTLLKIQKIASQDGYELKDAHTMNMLFRGSQAVYVDIGSFQKKESDEWVAYEEFLNSFYIPLCFWGEGHFYITRKLLESKFYRMQTIPNQKFTNSGFFSLLNEKITYTDIYFKNKNIKRTENIDKAKRIVEISNDLIKFVKRSPSYAFTSRTKYYDEETIEKRLIQKYYPNQNSLWKGYHSKFYGQDQYMQISSRFERILSIIEDINNRDSLQSVLDLAGNEGMMSFLVKHRCNIPIVSLADYDENALEVACENRKKSNIDINILLLNFMFPPNIDDVASRVKSDLVMALAVTHHLILTAKYLLPTILERIKAYSNKYVLIEFMPKGLWSIEHKKDIELPEYYTQDWFTGEFEKLFDIQTIVQLEENRVLFVGKIKD